MLQNIILTIIAIILSVIGYFLKDAPIFIRELKVEKLRNENQSNLQVESYFREISGKDLQQTFKSWLTLIDDMKDNKLKGKALDTYVKDLQVKTFMYGSSTTIKINATMMQLLYQNNTHEKKIQVDFGKEKEPDYRIIVYTAYIIASLKKDFTGYDISPRDFLEVKINDLNDTKEAFDKAEKQVKKELLKKNIKL